MAGIRPQLAESAHLDQLRTYIDDPDWVLEPKLDGQRLLCHIKDGTITMLNRAGQPKVTNLSYALLAQLEALAPSSGVEWVLDGELVKGTLHLFDLPVCGDIVVLGETPLTSRLRVLRALFETWQPDEKLIRPVLTAVSLTSKRMIEEMVRGDHGEGLMAKHVRSVYRSGARSRDWQKLKFVTDADFIILRVGDEGKDNVVLGLLDPVNGRVVEVGKASAIGKKPEPEAGQVWVVRFLYVVDPANPRLYQPRLMQIRSDKRYEECLIDQIQDSYTKKEIVYRTRAEM